MNLRCDILDSAVSGRVLAVVQPAELEVAAEALRQLEHRDKAASTQWRMRLERAEYEAQLAQRRYEEVDPSNRLVAATLEQRWNDALVRLEEIRTQSADFQSKEAIVVTLEQRARVAELAQDFPRLWNTPTTQAKDKKRILRLLIKDITVERFGEHKTAVLHVRWQGGACEDLRWEAEAPRKDGRASQQRGQAGRVEPADRDTQSPAQRNQQCDNARDGGPKRD